MNPLRLRLFCPSAWIALAMGVVLTNARLMGSELPKQGLTAESQGGMVVSVSKPASDVGFKILEQGGNAVDAAVAVALALQVTWPEAGNIGGGGFMLVHSTDKTSPVVIDYRERAPAAATVDMFAAGAKSEYLKVGVPGTVRGLEAAHQRFGRLSWQKVVKPSVELARDGFVVSRELAQSLNSVIKSHPDNIELRRVYGKLNGRDPWTADDRLIQPDLARTLELIATDGADAFYKGPIAELFEAEMKQGGGLITRSDLADYQARERNALHGTYRGFDIYGPPPPSSGGTVLIEMLNTVEGFQLRDAGRYSAKTIHTLAEAMKRAYCDRARHLGDPDFSKFPEHLLSKEYGRSLASAINPTAATPSSQLGADILSEKDHPNTTHFSIIDRDGMAVSNTYTLEDSFGSCIVVRGGGFLLNNEMGDFNPKPGFTNKTGQIGTPPNLVAPGKRMLSSMTPVIVSQNGNVVLVTGSPGGRTIINTVFCVVLNVLEFEMPLRDAIDAPRMHHQWMPDVLQMEEPLLRREMLIDELKLRGHTMNPKPTRQGDAHSIGVSKSTGQRTGVVDPRRSGWAAGE